MKFGFARVWISEVRIGEGFSSVSEMRKIISFAIK